MRLISCDNCAVMLDEDKLAWPSTIWQEDGCIDGSKAAYNQQIGEYSAFVNCPVCDSQIFKEKRHAN